MQEGCAEDCSLQKFIVQSSKIWVHLPVVCFQLFVTILRLSNKSISSEQKGRIIRADIWIGNVADFTVHVPRSPGHSISSPVDARRGRVRLDSTKTHKEPLHATKGILIFRR